MLSYRASEPSGARLSERRMDDADPAATQTADNPPHRPAAPPHRTLPASPGAADVPALSPALHLATSGFNLRGQQLRPGTGPDDLAASLDSGAGAGAGAGGRDDNGEGFRGGAGGDGGFSDGGGKDGGAGDFRGSSDGGRGGGWVHWPSSVVRKDAHRSPEM
jgi:hypothetical protein